MKNSPWWSGINDVWSNEKTVYLTTGDNIDSQQQWLGDFIFHRFYGTDDYDPREVKVFLVEAKEWSQWEHWLEKHKANNKTLVPKYVHPLEQVLITRKGFRIIKWVDEYRPFEFRYDALI